MLAKSQHVADLLTLDSFEQSEMEDGMRLVDCSESLHCLLRLSTMLALSVYHACFVRPQRLFCLVRLLVGSAQNVCVEHPKALFGPPERESRLLNCGFWQSGRRYFRVRKLHFTLFQM